MLIRGSVSCIVDFQSDKKCNHFPVLALHGQGRNKSDEKFKQDHSDWQDRKNLGQH